MSSSGRFLRAYGDTDFITGLRAIAASMVVIIHTGAFAGFGPIGEAATVAGKYGVDIFFVISGFTIAKTYGEADSYTSYLIRRVMRIAPFYWVVISAVLALIALGLFPIPYWMDHFGGQPDLYNWLMHLGFVSYLDHRVANSVLGVEWSIPIEVFWYAVLPLLLAQLVSLKRTAVLILIALLLTALTNYAVKTAIGTSTPVKWTPIAQAHLFFVGAAAFYLRDRLAGVDAARLRPWVWAAILAFTAPFLAKFGGRGELLALATAVFLVTLRPLYYPRLTGALSCRPMLFLGSISYSIYLLHPVAITLVEMSGLLPAAHGPVFLLAVYALTVAMSAVTYAAIERPTNALGRAWVAQRAKGRRPA